MPDAVVRGRDGYLRVYYDRLGMRFETYDRWVASGARVPNSQVKQLTAWRSGAAVDTGRDHSAHQSLNTPDHNN